PGYNSYLGGTLLSEASMYKYPLRPEENFLINLDRIPADVLKKTKILYLNYPNNPTSAIAPKEYLEEIVRRCKELDILLVYDNAYSELAYDGYVPPSIFEIEGARDVAIEFHSMSKTYNMTGWRCGWACGKAEFVGAEAIAVASRRRDSGHPASGRATGHGARLMIFRRIAPRTEGTRKRFSTPFLVSLGVHVVVAIAFMRMLILNAELPTSQKRVSASQE